MKKITWHAVHDDDVDEANPEIAQVQQRGDELANWLNWHVPVGDHGGRGGVDDSLGYQSDSCNTTGEKYFRHNTKLGKRKFQDEQFV